MSDERAGFLEEESEERIEQDLLVCEAKQRGFQGGMAPLVGGHSPRRGAGSEANVGGEKAKLFPSKEPMWEIAA